MIDDKLNVLINTARELDKAQIENDEKLEKELENKLFSWDDLLTMFYQFPSGLWRYKIIEMMRQYYPQEFETKFKKKGK